MRRTRDPMVTSLFALVRTAFEVKAVQQADLGTILRIVGKYALLAGRVDMSSPAGHGK